MMQLPLIARYRVLSVLSLAVVLLLSTAAHAQSSRSFRISGGGIAPLGLPSGLGPENAKPHFATGEATHLGRHSGNGAFQLDSFEPVIVGENLVGFQGKFRSSKPFEFLAANGDKLVVHYGNEDFGAATPGTYQIKILGVTDAGVPIVSVVFLAEFVVQPSSTGRFRGTTGSWIMEARSTEPFVLFSNDPTPYVWEGKGRISLPKK